MYASIADLRARYSSEQLDFLADKSGETGKDTVLTAALVDAGTVIDGYISARTKLPFTFTPSSLTRCACIIAFYSLHEETVTEKVQRDYDGVIQFLERIAAGDVSIGVDSATDTQETLTVVIEGDSTVWGRDVSKGYL